MLADSFGVAATSAEKYKALTMMHLATCEVLQQELIDLYGEPIPVVVDKIATTIPVNKVRDCIGTAAPWHPPHLTSLRWVENEEPINTLPG